MKKVLLAMSGGVDSSLSALRLLDAGYDVEGITFIMRPGDETTGKRAALAAAEAGIRHRVVSVEEEFSRAVLLPFTGEYTRGRTPNPCVLCNMRIKFPLLAREAARLGCELIATGHYAKVEDISGNKFIAEADDRTKDQSYFLWPLDQEILSRLILPLGGATKAEVKAEAARRGLSAASVRESQDICFIPDGDVGSYIAKRLESEGRPLPEEGDFTDSEGNLLGKHRGIWRYTPGQRRGLGVPADSRLYVLEIDVENNRVILGRESDLYSGSAEVTDVSFASGLPPHAPFRSAVRLRYTKKFSHATVVPEKNGICTVSFDTPQRAPAPGQSAVFYTEEPVTAEGGRAVIGGGFIG
ncbi:MAG: tRNA 2-thiouridine(34) synthase MnmA [Clostridia bacterium]|nr:tRNA 2-thiouridine(34) synthase MnmA [Clostridia bacterium]